jgi:hypothetical protein
VVVVVTGAGTVVCCVVVVVLWEGSVLQPVTDNRAAAIMPARMILFIIIFIVCYSNCRHIVDPGVVKGHGV